MSEEIRKRRKKRRRRALAAADATEDVADNRAVRAKNVKQIAKANKATVTCAHCMHAFPRITSAHLRTHGLTVSQYRRMYLAPLRPGEPADPFAPRPKMKTTTSEDTLAAIGEVLTTSPEFIYRIADEVSESIFSSSIRDKLRLSIISVISARLAQHGEAVAFFEGLRKELAQPWRRTHGGPDGTPTKTETLIAMTYLALQDIKSTEDVLLRTVKMSIDEKKGEAEEAAKAPLDEARYSGKHEILPMLNDMTPAERETFRHLFTGLQKFAAERRQGVAQPTDRQMEITVQALPAGDPALEKEVASPPTMTPTQEPPRVSRQDAANDF